MALGGAISAAIAKAEIGNENTEIMKLTGITKEIALRNEEAISLNTEVINFNHHVNIMQDIAFQCINEAEEYDNLIVERIINGNDVKKTKTFSRELAEMNKETWRDMFRNVKVGEKNEIELQLAENTKIRSQIKYKGKDRTCKGAQIHSQIVTLVPEQDGRSYLPVEGKIGAYKSSDPINDEGFI